MDNAQFLKDVAKHRMVTMLDEGVRRHIRFVDPDTTCMHFDLITWPGVLCYTGDMGTFVFTRLHDMFVFFRTPPKLDATYSIDRRYWAEKVIAAGGRGDGVCEFDPEAFKREVIGQWRRMMSNNRGCMTKEDRHDAWESLGSVLDAADEGEPNTIVAVQDWSHRFKNTSTGATNYLHLDTSEFPDCKKYTGRFEWCCNALAWGINFYDAEKRAAGVQ